MTRMIRIVTCMGLAIMALQNLLIYVAYSSSLLPNSGQEKDEGMRTSSTSNHDPPSGTFNNMNIYYRDGSTRPIHSTAHCIGDNFQEKAWHHKSCQFRNLCFDLDKKEFVLFRDPSIEAKFTDKLNAGNDAFTTISSTMANTTVSIGGINPRWSNRPDGVPRLEWFPTILPHELDEPYYSLDQNVVWTPYHSIAGWNPGHLIWDEFLPIYTLLSIFDLLQDKQIFMMRYVMKPALWATCEDKPKLAKKCDLIYKKFLPLMGIDNDFFTTTDDFRLNLNSESNSKDTHIHPPAKYICSPYGAAGIGMLTDHGKNLHGWDPKDFLNTHNHGRGALLYNFRNFLLQNIGVDPKPLTTKPPYKIVFSTHSSSTTQRSKAFTEQINAIKKSLPEDQIIVETYQMHKLPLVEQAQIASECAIYVTVCGGGAITAQFLPKGSSLFIYYADNRKNLEPAPLDWDLFNNIGTVRTQWLPIRNKESPEHLDTFVELVKHELDMISHLSG